MKPVNEMVDQTLKASQQNSERKPKAEFSPQEERLMATLWLRLAEIYGKNFLTMHGRAWSDTWARVITKYSPAEVGIALERLLKSKEFVDWPPNLRQFEDFLKPVVKHPSHIAFPVSRPETDAEFAARRAYQGKKLAQLRSRLRV